MVATKTQPATAPISDQKSKILKNCSYFSSVHARKLILVLKIGNPNSVSPARECFAVAATKIELFSKNMISNYFVCTLPHDCKIYG